MSALDGIVLTGLADQFGSDKGIQHASALNYMPLYAEYFARHGFDRSKPLRILEIGTNKGASLRTWAEYFPNAKVYGLDITRQYEIAHLLEHANIKTAIADQGNRDAIRSALRNSFYLEDTDLFDLIIDDGSHEQSDQQISLGYLFTHWLRSGGLYVVEDLITGENWWNGNIYNKKGILATRNVLQIMQQTGGLDSPVMMTHESDYIRLNHAYCEYRVADKIIYQQHKPQIAFIGKKS